MLVSDALYYLYIVLIYKQVSMLLDHLGITLEKRKTDCRNFYLIGGALFVIAISTLVICLANKSIAGYIGPTMTIFGFAGIGALSIFYKDCYSQFVKRESTFYKKIALVLVIVVYLYANRLTINQANNHIEKTCFNRQSIR